MVGEMQEKSPLMWNQLARVVDDKQGIKQMEKGQIKRTVHLILIMHTYT
jgi:hypothetical protein